MMEQVDVTVHSSDSLVNGGSHFVRPMIATLSQLGLKCQASANNYNRETAFLAAPQPLHNNVRSDFVSMEYIMEY